MEYLIIYNTVGILLLTLVNTEVSNRPDFRNDYRYEKAFNSFYKLHRTAATWSEARIRCEGEGTVLMYPGSLDEADAMPILVATILVKFKGVFVGIHDLYSERTFVTIKGSTVQGTILNLLWEYKEPMHSGGRCVGMRRNGLLFVHPCSDPLPFICKANADDITYTKECNSFNAHWKLGPEETCYYVHEEPQTWHTAYATCLSAGGHLAIINSRKEAEHIRDLYKKVEDRRQPDNDFAFLGFSDILQLRHYRTVHGERLEKLGFTDWELKCTTENATNIERRCGGIRRSGLLSTNKCDKPAMFFCEKLANSIKHTNTLRQVYKN